MYGYMTKINSCHLSLDMPPIYIKGLVYITVTLTLTLRWRYKVGWVVKKEGKAEKVAGLLAPD